MYRQRYNPAAHAVVALAAFERVVALAALRKVVARAAEQNVFPVSAEEAVFARPTIEEFASVVLVGQLLEVEPVADELIATPRASPLRKMPQ